MESHQEPRLYINTYSIQINTGMHKYSGIRQGSLLRKIIFKINDLLLLKENKDTSISLILLLPRSGISIHGNIYLFHASL